MPSHLIDCSIVSHHEKGSSSSDPVFRLLLRWKLKGENEVGGVTRGTQLTTSCACLVEWTWVAAGGLWLSHCYGLEPDHWESDDWDSWITVCYSSLAEVPLCSLQIQAMYVDTVVRSRLNSISEDVPDGSTVSQLVDGSSGLTSVCLQSSSHEALGEVEGWGPVACWRALVQPASEECNSSNQVSDP